ncbi:MAG: tRNA 2-selenouridine(34) synthase MnmH [Lentimicrobium sp.]|jgi:tRNA 2-selenouridine synthase|nr:tRNA 2-selenouridine(34) synthase MnmH [Lentimicrobium sp.]
MIPTIDAGTLFNLRTTHLLIDVRSPAEYDQAHIPGAINLPLFNNEERAQVGIRYANAGKNAALLLGLEIAGPKLAGFVKKINGLTHKKVEGIIVQCWRGGMRSQAMAWLLEFAGYPVKVLEGGYKAYRSFIRQHLTDGPEFIIVGGMTGSGKTPLLAALQSLGEQILDLEALASNRGSVFGYLGQHEQPNNEQFENDLYERVRLLNHEQKVWVEDESRSIGTVALPDPFFKKMKNSPLIFLQVPIKDRIRRIIAEYGMFDASLLTDAVARLRQHLGTAKVEQIILHINQGNFKPAVSELLKYYDHNYLKAFEKFNTREVEKLIITDDDMIAHARQIILLAQKF